MKEKRTELSAAEREVLEQMITEKRANTQRLVEVSSLGREEIEVALGDLTAAGHVREITDDLYEVSEALSLEADGVVYRGIPDPNPDTQTAPIDPTDFDDE